MGKNENRAAYALIQLGLSSRALNALQRAGITTIDQLRTLSYLQLANIKGIGEKTAAEIHYKMAAWSSRHSTTPSTTDEHDDVEPTPLSVLKLSIRPYNALMRSHIRTVEQLLSMTRVDLLAVRNIGTKSADEIESKLDEYLTHHPHLRRHLPSPTADDQEPEHPRPLQPREFPLVERELLEAAQAAGIPLAEISIDRLGLRRAEWHALYTSGTRNLNQLLRQPLAQWQDYPFIAMRVREYLSWLLDQNPDIWHLEELEYGLNPFLRSQLSILSLSRMIRDWLAELSVKERFIITRRYGLQGTSLTLQKIGVELRLTRERIRQLQNRAEQTLTMPVARFNIYLVQVMLYHLIRQSGGIVPEQRLAPMLSNAMEVGEVNPIGAIHLILTLAPHARWLRDLAAWALRTYPVEQGLRIQRAALRILNKNGVSLTLPQMLCAIQKEHPFSHHPLQLSFIEACLRSHPAIYIDHRGYCGLLKWQRSHTDMIVLALRELRKPSHYSVIAAKANELLRSTPMSEHNVHAILGRRSDIFVRVGHGIFGLQEWGLPDDGNVANAIYRVLSEAGRPLHLSEITDRVLETWKVRPGTVYVALTQDSRFVNVGKGIYQLKKWLTAS